MIFQTFTKKTNNYPREETIMECEFRDFVTNEHSSESHENICLNPVSLMPKINTDNIINMNFVVDMKKVKFG